MVISSCVRRGYVRLEALQVFLLFARRAQVELLELGFFLVAEEAVCLQLLFVGAGRGGADGVEPGHEVDGLHVEHADGLDCVALLVAREVLADDGVFLAEACRLVFGLLRNRLERADEVDGFDRVSLADEVFDLPEHLLLVREEVQLQGLVVLHFGRAALFSPVDREIVCVSERYQIACRVHEGVDQVEDEAFDVGVEVEGGPGEVVVGHRVLEVELLAAEDVVGAFLEDVDFVDVVADLFSESAATT